MKIFTIPFTKGDINTSLDGPNKIILSESTAKKYFADEDAIGKNITVREGGNAYHYEVTGIFRDYPANSHLAFNYIISYKTY